jgi:hypothetical protein
MKVDRVSLWQPLAFVRDVRNSSAPPFDDDVSSRIKRDLDNASALLCRRQQLLLTGGAGEPGNLEVFEQVIRGVVKHGWCPERLLVQDKTFDVILILRYQATGRRVACQGVGTVPKDGVLVGRSIGRS